MGKFFWSKLAGAGIFLVSIMGINHMLAIDIDGVNNNMQPAELSLAQMQNARQYYDRVVLALQNVAVGEQIANQELFLSELRGAILEVGLFLNDLAEQIDEPLAPGMPGRVPVAVNVNFLMEADETFVDLLNRINTAAAGHDPQLLLAPVIPPLHPVFQLFGQVQDQLVQLQADQP